MGVHQTWQCSNWLMTADRRLINRQKQTDHGYKPGTGVLCVHLVPCLSPLAVDCCRDELRLYRRRRGGARDSRNGLYRRQQTDYAVFCTWVIWPLCMQKHAVPVQHHNPSTHITTLYAWPTLDVSAVSRRRLFFRSRLTSFRMRFQNALLECASRTRTPQHAPTWGERSTLD